MVKDLSWVPIPNKHDGERYSRLMTRKDASEIFSVWILLLQVASRCHPRGTLLRSDGKPHDSESLSIKTRAPIKWFDIALPVLMQMTWIEQVASDCQAADTVLPPSCQSGDEERKKEGTEMAPCCHDEEFVESWNQLGLPKCLELNVKRRTCLRQRMEEKFFSENWRKAMEKIKISRFCNGDNKTGWKANFDFFIRPGTVAKLMEGSYDGKTQSARPQIF